MINMTRKSRINYGKYWRGCMGTVRFLNPGSAGYGVLSA